ncbi:ribonuclease III domain-containing protein [Poronia punctata]|nr:ribonuclease III domain-containing protein [Poronia punctata]
MNKIQKLQLAQQITGHTFKNPDWLWEALQAAGSDVSKLNGRTLPEGNRPLAGLGDLVIDLIIKSDCYNSNMSTGSTVTLLQTRVNNNRLARLCGKSGLAECINLNPSQSLATPILCAATVEAVVGAVYQDTSGNLANVRDVMSKMGIIDWAGSSSSATTSSSSSSSS